MNFTSTLCRSLKFASACRICSTYVGGDLDGFLAEAHGRDEVLHAGAALVAVDVAKPTDFLRAADLDALELLFDEHLVQRRALLGLVVPDLDLDAAILRAAGLPSRSTRGLLSPAHS